MIEPSMVSSPIVKAIPIIKVPMSAIIKPALDGIRLLIPSRA
jgi:hypothetical protein